MLLRGVNFFMMDSTWDPWSVVVVVLVKVFSLIWVANIDLVLFC